MSAAGGRLLVRLDRWQSHIENLFNHAAGLVIFALMLTGVAQIVGRKLLGTPIFGYIDMVELSMSAFAFLGIAYCQRRGGHVRMEILLSRLSGRALWLCESLATLIGLFLIAVLIVYGYDHFLRAWSYGDSTIDAQFPVWPSKLIVPIALGLLWLRLAIQLAGYLRLLRHPEAPPLAVPLVHSRHAQADREIHETAIADG